MWFLGSETASDLNKKEQSPGKVHGFDSGRNCVLSVPLVTTTWLYNILPNRRLSLPSASLHKEGKNTEDSCGHYMSSCLEKSWKDDWLMWVSMNGKCFFLRAGIINTPQS
jgi:hypothetical protein